MSKDNRCELLDELQALEQRSKELWDYIYSQMDKMPEHKERHEVNERIWTIKKELRLV